MKVKKTKINGIDTFIYNTKRYSSINVRFFFQIPYTKENMYTTDLLEEYMVYTNKKYTTRKSLNNRRMELYSLGYSLDSYNVGEKLFCTASFSFCDPLLVKDDYLDEALEFASQIMLNPNFKEGKSDKQEMRRCRDNLINCVADKLLDNNYKAMWSYIDVAYPDTYKTIDKICSKEEYIEDLEKVTDEKLIEMHEEIFKNSCVGIIIMGNIKNEYINFMEKYFKEILPKSLEQDYEVYLKINTKTPFYTKQVDKDYHESILRCAFDCPAKTRKDEMIYAVISDMMSSSGLLLHKVLREEMKLVYRTTSKYGRFTSSLVMFAFLDKANEEKAIEGFDKVIDLLKNKKIVSELLEKIKEEDELYMYTYYESKQNPFSNLYNKALKFDIDISKKTKIIRSLTVEDIISHVESMKKVKIHFYEGSKK